jgi:hypothetical protein
MVAASTVSLTATLSAKTVSVARLLVTGGATAAIVFILCWVGTFIPFSSPTHAYIGLFTNADATSVQALAQGTIWSLLFGALVGAVFALIYNGTARIGRK